MSPRPRLPGLKVVAELAVIVAGILLALAADAAWDARNDRQRERAYLHALLVEMRDAKEELAVDEVGRLNRLAGLDSLRLLFGQDGSRADSVAEWARRGTGLQFFFPPTAVYNDLLSSGGLALIRSGELRAALMAYDQEAARLRRMEEREDAQIQGRFRPYLAASFWIADEQAPPDLVTQVLSDRRFHNLVNERRGLMETTMRYATRVDAAIIRVIELLENEVPPGP